MNPLESKGKEHYFVLFMFEVEAQSRTVGCAPFAPLPWIRLCRCRVSPEPEASVEIYDTLHTTPYYYI